ncbi:probable protein arginine N-methyltransferase 3 [Selaginella moellendorffii]|uniref:probable protein arginine N-methyltransferase 3 n=1 Tax=Selaginella moellendorffii TaxID=88036 RepID=UPI000D1C90CF|nr:probable protein arginine N-methyltransferase 3 [Selaginella moellendorffii]|eukprot:XP_024521105.1 probable protein arginine N-methyltransferase 3 [Selaginella moellendorffii]
MSSSEDEDGAGWEDWAENADDAGSIVKCLLCSSSFSSADQAFRHCSQQHGLDFGALRLHSRLDFYQALRLLNFIRSEVAAERCWNCGAEFQDERAFQDHVDSTRHCSLPGSDRWKDDFYLAPFLKDDALLYNFDLDDIEEDGNGTIDRDEIISELANLDPGEGSIDEAIRELATSSLPTSDGKLAEKKKRVSFDNVVKEEILRVNSKYFSSYGEYGIHREMLGDKVRTEAYQKAILHNPPLLENALVMDIGCGTGILSLFAAKAGASKVIAVDGSEKMAMVAREVARDNGFISDGSSGNTIEVVGGMIEDLDGKLSISPHSVDVIISEWMGYGLLYESMLGSVLHARDRWLKPGGSILPDTAEMFVAGFGKGATSLPFWEDVYGFNMKRIGNEVLEHAANAPVVDVVNKEDIVTDSFSIQKFDILTMKPDDVDFHAHFELKPRTASPVWCYGVVLWFDVGFTERCCKVSPVTMTTSPFSPSTHWSQTILTFRNPILLSRDASAGPGEPGTKENPAALLKGRISIARSFKHRSIDISLETAAVAAESGAAFPMPVQIFGL